MDKYELLALNDLLRMSKEEEKYLRYVCAKRKMPSSSTEQLRGKIREPGGEPVSSGLVNGAVSLDDHAILAERERKSAHGEK